MDIFSFFSEEPYIVVVFIIIITTSLNYLLKFICRLLNDFYAYRNIVKHGYPPPYCNANGDTYEDDEEYEIEDDE